MSFSISIIGPTGSGKTSVALALARRLPVEIINADIGQMYQPFSVGVAQPTAAELAVCPHHLFTFLSAPKDFSVTEYRLQVEKIVKEVLKRRNIPVFVGGSTFYQQSLFKKIPSIAMDKLVVERESARLEGMTNKQLWQELYLIDPERANVIHPNDPYRLIRALLLWYGTKKKPSFFTPVLSPITSQGFALFIRLPRSVLYERINKRTGIMLEAGWLDEVAALSSEWRTFAIKKGLIGYREIIEKSRDGEFQSNYSSSSFQSIVASIQQQTRNYAKRQETFFRKLERELDASDWKKGFCADLTLSGLDLYIEQIEQIYKSQV